MQLEPHRAFAHLLEKIHQEDITRTQIDTHKIYASSTLSSPMNSISKDIDILTVHDVRTMEQYSL